MPEKPPAFLDTDPWKRARERKPTLPGAAELAELIRGGFTVDELAEEFQRSDKTLRVFLNQAGFNGVTGEPNHQEHADDGLPRLAKLFEVPAWYVDAICAQTDPESFFPIKGGSTREAKDVCSRCTVAAECLDYAIDNDERFGIWGGLSERERRRLKHAMAADPAAPVLDSTTEQHQESA